MSLLNDSGSTSNGVVISIGIHIAILMMIIFSGQIKQLPFIEDLINSRTDAKFSPIDETEDVEDISVTFEESTPAPKKIIRKKIKKAAVLKAEKKLTPKKEIKEIATSETESKSDLKVNKEENPKKSTMISASEIALKTNNKRDRENYKKQNEVDSPKESVEKLAKEESLETTVDESLPKDKELDKKTNPFEKKSKTAGLIDGLQDGRKLRQIGTNPKPVYPEDSRLRREHGTVELKYFVDQNGLIRDLRIHKSSGYPYLDDEAINKIQDWKFERGQSGETIHPVTFKLKGSPERLKSRARTSSAER